MKPITHYRDLTTRYLRQHPKRSLLTLFGIILSVALMFSSSVMGESMKAQQIQSIKDRYGDYHAAYTGITDSQIQRLKDNANVAQVGVKLDVGMHKDPRGNRLAVSGGDDSFRKMMGLTLASGRLPEAPGEIVMEQWFAENMAEKPKLGDRITLQLRQEPSLSSGIETGEGKVIPYEGVVTGFLRNKTTTQLSGFGFALVTVDAAKQIMGPEADAALAAGVTFKQRSGLQKVMKETAGAIGIPEAQVQPNRALLTILGQSGNTANNNAVVIAQIIVVGIILVATVAVIYNAFHISVIERIRQFGVLRSIGMTPRQIRAVVFGEASILAGLGIPLGLLFGWLTMKVILALFAYLDQTGYFDSMRISIPWYIWVGSVVLGAAAVYLSAFGPAWSAGRVPPLAAILHQNRFNKEKVTRRKRRLVSALLGITGKMAVDNLKRNRRRFRITLFSMSIGVALFVFFWSLMSFMQLSQSNVFAKDYALEKGWTPSSTALTREDFAAAEKLPGVETAYRVMIHDSWNVRVPVEKLTEDYRQESSVADQPGRTFGLPFELRGYRPGDLELNRPRLIGGSLDAEAMDRDNGVVISQKLTGSGGIVQASNLKVGDTIEIVDAGDEARKPFPVKVLGIVDKAPISYHGGSERYTLITTENVFKRITGLADVYFRFDLSVDRNADQAAIKDGLEKLAAKHDSARVMDFVNDPARGAMLIISILLYGLVTVISVISAINIINTISTNLILRTREFGTMRAVGMTMGQLRRMIMYESLWYGFFATLYGGAAGVLLARWLYSLMNRLQDIPYRFPWQAVLGSGAAAVLICLIASRIPLRRIERMDVVQAIRAEE